MFLWKTVHERTRTIANLPFRDSWGGNAEDFASVNVMITFFDLWKMDTESVRRFDQITQDRKTENETNRSQS